MTTVTTTMAALCAGIKKHVGKAKPSLAVARKAFGKAEADFVEAGKKMVQLYELHKKHKTKLKLGAWATYVQEYCGLSKPWAYDLMRIGAGKITLAELQASTISRVRVSRKNKKRRQQEKEFMERNAGACDIDPNEPEYMDEPLPFIRRRSFLNCAEHALKEATAIENVLIEQLDEAAPTEIDDEVMNAAQATAAAWADVVDKLQEKRRENSSRRKSNGKEAKKNHEVVV